MSERDLAVATPTGPALRLERLHPRRLARLAGAEWRTLTPRARLVLALLLAGSAVGAVCAAVALPPGLEVMGTSPSVEWGLLIVGYVVFAIMTSGLCLTSSLGTVLGIDRYRPLERRHAILAVLSLTTAFGVIILELHWPLRMLPGVILSPAPSSPMWWMGVAYGGYLAILVVEIWSMFTHRPRIHQIVCTMAAGMAIVAPSTLGAVFGALANRPFWHGPIASLWMLATALLAGCALLGVVFALVVGLGHRGADEARDLVVPGLRPILAGLLLLSALFLVRLPIAAATSAEPGMADAVDALMAGSLAPAFWIGRVALGLVLPFLLLVHPLARRNGAFLAASALALAGVALDRTLYVIGGLIRPTSSSTGGVVARPDAVYVPSLVEIGIIVGAVSLVALAYLVLERYLDLGRYDRHVGFRLAPVRRWLASRRESAGEAAS